MIIRSSFHGPDGLGAHLACGDVNDEVTLRDDLSQGCDLDIRAAISDFAAMDYADKNLVHFVISPSKALSPAEARRMIDELGAAYAISPRQPRLVVEHRKPGAFARDNHFHIAYPRRDVGSGLLIRDSWHRNKNDRLAVQLDAEFAAPTIVPIVHKASVQKWLTEHAPQTLAEIEARGGLKTPQRKPPDRSTAAEQRRAGVAGIEVGDFADRVLLAFDAAHSAPKEVDWFAAGLRLARGDRCVMVVDMATGHTAALNRTLNAAAKREGQARRWKNADLRGLISREAPSLSAAIGAPVISLIELSSTDSGASTSSPASSRSEERRRGRPRRAGTDELAAEQRRRAELAEHARARLATDVARIKADAATARRESRAMPRELRTFDKMASSDLGVVAGIAFVAGGPAAAAAAALLLHLLQRRRRKNLEERARAKAAAGDVRAQLDRYFGELRRRRENETRDREIGRLFRQCTSTTQLVADVLLREAAAGVPDRREFSAVALVARKEDGD